MSERPGRYERSFRGMVGAMLVLLLVVAAFVVFRDVNRNDATNPVEAVDFAPTASFARQEAAFPVSVPEPLPEGWRATSARFERDPADAWHLGMLTDRERYVGLEQAAETVEELVELHLDPGAEEGDPVTVAGDEWRTFTDADGDLGLGREARGGGTLVYGRVSRATLEQLIATLR